MNECCIITLAMLVIAWAVFSTAIVVLVCMALSKWKQSRGKK